MFTRSNFLPSRICRPKLLIKAAAALLLLSSPVSGRATTFDWPNPPGWTAGAPGNNQTKTQSFTNLSANDITVSIANVGVTWSSGYPDINSTKTTGGFSGTNALQLFGTKQSSTSSYIQVTVAFSYAVTNLSFQLWDIDASSGQFADTISQIQGLAQGGGTVGATTVSSAVAGYNTITGSDLSTVVTGTASADNTTNQGTINFSFAEPITQFSFQWSNSDSGLGQQAIGLGPLTYDPTPESGSGWAAAGVCLGAIGGCQLLGWRRKKQQA